jgi:hypothetical protein
VLSYNICWRVRPIYYERHTVNAESHQSNLSRCLFPLFRTRNRELANLAQDMYYKRKIFHIVLGIWYVDLDEG